ncbi:TetR/AcrR family transcriptional regulator [Actinopolymorpha pittospori]|uniref:AcrR family transcriptional regulator n=1 Tax=Actinopolymorpha pittospori TaxID=648752 RepID=A0A927RAF0_9ACTN|nr:TetR/AcrR family transcriptional regulator [Actinopolymorpha pittospori]MBE1608912.1 AcrR family transcriptional regulator [Actinopolymorpha pittospori]
MVTPRPGASTRASRQTKTATTRRAIVEAARSLLAESADGHVSLEAVAVAAGVSRVTIYNQVGSRHGLLDAVLTDSAERGGMDQLLAHTKDEPARQACTSVIRRTCCFWAAERSVLRRLTGLAVVDPELARIFDTREGWRRRQLNRLLERLEEAGELTRTGAISRAAILDGFVALTSFQAYDRLGQLAEHPLKATRVLDQMLTGLIG